MFYFCIYLNMIIANERGTQLRLWSPLTTLIDEYLSLATLTNSPKKVEVPKEIKAAPICSRIEFIKLWSLEITGKITWEPNACTTHSPIDRLSNTAAEFERFAILSMVFQVKNWVQPASLTSIVKGSRLAIMAIHLFYRRAPSIFSPNRRCQAVRCHLTRKQDVDWQRHQKADQGTVKKK